MWVAAATGALDDQFFANRWGTMLTAQMGSHMVEREAAAAVPRLPSGKRTFYEHAQ